jgi:anti-sigma regulatory factor (Ser/Thr protein kinase)
MLSGPAPINTSVERKSIWTIPNLILAQMEILRQGDRDDRLRPFSALARAGIQDNGRQDMTQAEHASQAGGRTHRASLLRLRIRPRAREVRRARHWFRWCLQDWHDDTAAAAESVFAEVAANAVRHGRGRVTVTVQVLRGAVRCHVRDASWRRPRRLTGWWPELEEGRGMVIVAALADDWGVRRRLLGKTVWFEVRDPGLTPAGLTGAPSSDLEGASPSRDSLRQPAAP